MGKRIQTFITRVLAAILLVAPLAVGQASATSPVNLVSVSNSGAALDSYAVRGYVTPDAHSMLFQTSATNVISGVTMPQDPPTGITYQQVYLRDLTTGQSKIVSVNTAGQPANNGASSAIAVSADGNSVLFSSYATNLAGSRIPENGCYLHNVQANTTVLVNPFHEISGVACFDANAAGNKVLIGNNTTSNVPGIGCPHFPCNWDQDGYVWDKDTNIADPIAIDESGNYGQFNNGLWRSYRAYASSISADGNLVAFVSPDSLIANEPAASSHLYIRNMSAGTLQSILPGPGETINPNTQAVISADGNHAVYLTLASNNKYRLYERNLTTGVTTPEDLTPSGGVPNGSSYEQTVSPDGRFIAFRSDSTNLTAAGSSAGDHVFVRDLQTNTVLQYDINENGDQANGNSEEPQVTADGSIVFYSYATNLVSTSGPAPQIYLATRPTMSSLVQAVNAGGAASGAYASDSGFSGGSSYSTSTSVDTSYANNPAPQDVYKTVRYGNNFSYGFTGLTPNTDYKLRLNFNELYWGASPSGGGGVGSRVFNVAVNGQAALANYDIFQKAGGANKAVVEQVPVTSDASGNVSVQFTTVTDNAMVNGLELYSGTLPAEQIPPQAATSSVINAGGLASGSFSADNSFTGGSVYTTAVGVDTSGVTSPAPQDVYQTVRYGNFTYNVAGLTPSSQYKVRLHFNELYWGASSGSVGGAGSRVFNVAINGSQVLNNFDIYQTAGGANKANVQEFTATADAQGKVNIQFTTVIDNAMVNGIEVLPL